MALDNNWFSEIDPRGGTAFSLEVKQKLHEEQSEFQKIEVYETTHYGNLMVIDGCTMLTTRDNFIYHEMMAHWVLFSHPKPERVLIIGGGDCGTLKEVLKHPGVKQVEQVDIDERVTRVSEMFFPELCESNDDPRASLNFDDGIKWVKDAEDGTYDVIIVDSTDPVGPGEVLFSEEFYRHCYHALKSGGMVVQQSESPLQHTDLIVDMYKRTRAAGYLDVLTINFPLPIYPSGWWSATVACKDEPITHTREEDIIHKPFKTRYYNHAIHSSAAATPEFLGEALFASY